MESLGTTAIIGLAALGVAQALLVALNVYEHRRRVLARLESLGNHRPVGRALVVVPCKGRENGLLRNLLAILSQDHTDYEVTFVVEDAADPACVVIEHAMESSATPARLVVAGKTIASSQKVHNLLAATKNIAPSIDFVVFADSDGRPQTHWLRMAVSRLVSTSSEGHHIAAKTGYRWFIPKRPTMANHLLAAMNLNVLALFGRRHQPMLWGGSWSMTTADFQLAGVRSVWRNALSDDHVAAQAIAAAGLDVSFEPACVVTSSIDCTFGEMFSFVRRQYLITRLCATRWWFAALAASTLCVFTWSTLLVLCFDSFFEMRPWPLVSAALLATLIAANIYRGWALRSLSKFYAPGPQRAMRGVCRWAIWGAPLVDCLQWLAIFSSAFGRDVLWRDVRYTLNADGSVRRVGPASLRAPAHQNDAQPEPWWAGAPACSANTVELVPPHAPAESVVPF
jgi:hypothetical protein